MPAQLDLNKYIYHKKNSRIQNQTFKYLHQNTQIQINSFSIITGCNRKPKPILHTPKNRRRKL